MLSRSGRGREVKLFFATDIHGNERCFMKFINAARVYGAHVLVLGGDLMGKIVVPLYRRPRGEAVCQFRGNDYQCRTQAEIEALMKEIRQCGCYPYLTSEEEMREIAGNEEAERALFHRLGVETLARWMEIADQRLRGTGVEMYVSLGNDDPPQLAEVLRAARTVSFVEGEVALVADTYPMVSYGYSPPTPWNSPREVGEAQLYSDLTALIRKVGSCERTIFNIHVPPYNSGLDVAPLLDGDLNVRYSATGDILTGPTGSHACRQVLEEHMPLVALHGHVHESRGMFRLGRTIAFNPGSDYPQSVLHGVLMLLSDSQVKAYTFTTG